MKRRIVGLAGGALVLIAAVAGVWSIAEVNQRGQQDAPLARADCAELAGGVDATLEWQFKIQPGWLCHWDSADGREGGSTFISWNTYQ